MARLEYQIDTEYHELRLTDVVTSIGRADDCTLQLLHDPGLSRLHCSIRLKLDNTYVLVDEKATNGTFLDEKRVSGEGERLKDHDQIRVGKTILTFRDSEVGRTTMALREVEQQMGQGKGFSTIMRNIVRRDKPRSDQEGPAGC